MKEKSKCFKSSIEREVDLAQKERNEFKKKFIEFEKKVIELEIVNESLESEVPPSLSSLGLLKPAFHNMSPKSRRPWKNWP